MPAGDYPNYPNSWWITYPQHDLCPGCGRCNHCGQPTHIGPIYTHKVYSGNNSVISDYDVQMGYFIN